jgi:hypothetical protein
MENVMAPAQKEQSSAVALNEQNFRATAKDKNKHAHDIGIGTQ